MRAKIRLILAFLAVFSVARAAFAEDISTLITLDKYQEWKLSGPASEASRLEIFNEKKGDSFPLVVRYKFRPDQNDYLFVEQIVPLPKLPSKVRMMVYGNGSGASLRLNFVDAHEEYFQAFVAKIDWEGWKDVEVPLTFPVHWGGDNDGNMDVPVKFYSLVLNAEKEQTIWEGEIRIAKLEVLSAAQASADTGASAAAAQGRSNVVTIDDFERANPLSVYQTWRGDLSSIDLVSTSEYKKAGNYATQLSYRLNTTRSEPSWVSTSFRPDRPLDWRGAQRLGLWVKGDGTRNYLQISFVDAKNVVWIYQSNTALRSVDWAVVEVPLADFQSPSADPDVVPDLSKIQKWEFTVVGERPEISSGKIWLDEFFLSGPSLDSDIVAPRTALTQAALEKLNIGFGDSLHMEYRQTPEFNKEFLYFNQLLVRSSVKNLTVAADLTSQQAEAGKTVPFYRPTQTSPATEPQENRPPVELAYLNATLQNLHPNLASLSFGNLYVDYGRDVFSPLYGFKGVQAEGNVGYAGQEVNANAFAIKHIFDSFSAGGRLQTMYNGALVRAMYIDHHDNAQKLGNAQISQTGTLSVPENSNIETDAVMNDAVFYTDINRSFWEQRLDLTGAYGVNHFSAVADKNITDPQNPKISRTPFAPVTEDGQMFQAVGRVKDWPILGFTFIATGRQFDRDFKPRFRADPLSYDSDVTDVRGYSLDFTQVIGRFKANFYWDDVRRGLSDSGYFRRVFRQTYGYYGWNRFDLVFSINNRREFYALPFNAKGQFTVDANAPRDEDVIFYELFLGHWFTDEFYIWSKFITEHTHTLRDNGNFRKDFFQLQGEYSVFKNAKLTVSVLQTRFDQSSFAPFATQGSVNNTTGSRTFERNIEDNRVRIYLDINF